MLLEHGRINQCSGELRKRGWHLGYPGTSSSAHVMIYWISTHARIYWPIKIAPGVAAGRNRAIDAIRSWLQQVGLAARSAKSDKIFKFCLNSILELVRSWVLINHVVFNFNWCYLLKSSGCRWLFRASVITPYR